MDDVEKYLLEDEDTVLDEKSQLFENTSTLKMNSVSDNEAIQLPNSNNSSYNYNNSELVHTTSNLTTINYRNNTTHQTNQPVHQRLFNNNYGI